MACIVLRGGVHRQRPMQISTGFLRILLVSESTSVSGSVDEPLADVKCGGVTSRSELSVDHSSDGPKIG